MTSLNGLKEYLRRYENLLQDKRQGKDEFTSEFQKVKRESEQLLRDGICKSSEGSKEHNKKKNRYKDILPFDHSRVILKSINNTEGSDFINANYVKTPEGRRGYIASQGPLPSTVNDFWRMIWQHRIKIIVMACKEIELGKHRCQRYWPLEGEQLQFDNIIVTLVRQKQLEENLTERQIKATLGTEELLLSQIHYTAWPDHGAPRSSRDIIRLVELMREIHPWDDPPVLVHCSAGCGRTGAIVAIDYGRRLIKKMPESFSVFDLVIMLRKQRPAMVQSREQYEYLYEVFKDLITERIKSSVSSQEAPPYVNIDFSPTEEIPIYENFDLSPKVSPKPLTKTRPVPVPDGLTATSQGVIVRGNMGQPRKPVITNNARLPQQATLRNDTHQPHLPPKPTPKSVNLLDGNQENTDGLATPLEPAQLTKIEIKKPPPEKDWAPQNYVNVSIGAPKTTSKQSPAVNKPPISSKKPDVHHQKSMSLSREFNMEGASKMINRDNQPFSKSKSYETLVEDKKLDLSPPVLPAKPNFVKKEKDHSTRNTEKYFVKSKSVNDLVDGERPPLPLKHRDILEFESCNSKITNGNEASLKRDNEMKQEFSNLKSNDPRMLLRTKADDEISTNKFVENPLKLFPNGHSDASYGKTESAKTESPFSVASSDNFVSRTKSAEMTESSHSPHTSLPKKATTLPMKGSSSTPNSDGLVSRSNFIVTVEKTEPKKLYGSGVTNLQGPGVKERPQIIKHPSAEAILVLSSRTDSPNSGKITRTNLANQNTAALNANRSERPNNILIHPAEQQQQQQMRNTHDETDSSPVYGVVNKPSSKPKIESFYESIWSPNKSPVRIDGPPALPARTADSFVILDETHFAEPSKKETERSISDLEEKITPTDESPSSASSDHASFPWLAVGVDKLRKKLSPKAAFSAAVRSNRQIPNVSNSSFFTQPTDNVQSSTSVTSPKTQNMNFDHRILQKPKGPRPQPSKWLPVKATSSSR